MSDLSVQQTKRSPALKRLDGFNRPWVRIATGLILGFVITLLTKSVIEYTVGHKLPLLIYLIPGLLATAILTARTWSAKELALTHDWQLLSVVANSKALTLISVALTIVPLALSASQAVDKQYLLPFDIYLYWVSGLSFFAFILLYKATAPAVFKYISYRDLIDREGSVRVLRDSVVELQSLAILRKGPFTPAREVLISGSDFVAIAKLDINDTEHQEQIYFLTREHTKYLKSLCRAGLSIMLIAPIFFISTITISKMYGVALQSNQTAQCYGGWIKATYWDMLKENSYIISEDKVESTSQCLRKLDKQENKISGS